MAAVAELLSLGQESMEIRDSAVEDAEQIAALIDAVARERLFLAATVGFSVDDTRAFITSTKSAGGVHVVGIESGEIVGWCDIVRHPFEGMRHVGRLGMGVRADRRSKGIGRKLLEAATEQAYGADIERIELEVFASNRAAICLYESFGFDLEGRKVEGRRLNGCADDILLYARRRLAS
jgi:ribosomal protein S18 acetylase RimI-like enzyme